MPRAWPRRSPARSGADNPSPRAPRQSRSGRRSIRSRGGRARRWRSDCGHWRRRPRGTPRAGRSSARSRHSCGSRRTGWRGGRSRPLSGNRCRGNRLAATGEIAAKLALGFDQDGIVRILAEVADAHPFRVVIFPQDRGQAGGACDQGQAADRRIDHRVRMAHWGVSSPLHRRPGRFTHPASCFQSGAPEAAPRSLDEPPQRCRAARRWAR
jgi:hypothetical protein